MGITETPTPTPNPTEIEIAVAAGATSSKLSLNVFQDIFKCIEPEVQIDEFEQEPGSGRGDNYTATLYRVHLRGHRKCSAADDADAGKKQKWEQALICKRLPENLQRREAYKSENLFRNEVEFYTTIIPELLKFQNTKVTDEVFNAMPKCFFARPDLLVMEDLRVRGFRMPDRKKGLTVAETEIVLKQVAQFHALSLAYKFENPKNFETLRKLTTEGLFCLSNESWYKNYYERLTKNAIKMVSDVLPPDSKYLEALKNFACSQSFFRKMVDLVSAETLLSAICHGDCWANNFLYRYDEDSGGGHGGHGDGGGDCSDPNADGCGRYEDGGDRKVLEVCLVDFQLIRFSSIALDIANLLFCCTTKSMRDEHLNGFISLYASETFRWLNLLSTHIPERCNTIEKFEEIFTYELKTYGRFALGLALDIIPISTCSSEDAPDLYMNRSNDDNEMGAPELNFPPNDLCRQKMAEIVIDMVEGEML